jgi:NAD(P)-dependent dehydrogenase (short-subunit alcohol dehydrogenase family)
MQQAILVTGSSTGIGRCLTERLAGIGHRVFATARRPEDLASLAAIANVTPIPLDVCDPTAIERAVEIVRARGLGLYGLVNNAGVGGIGPIASWTDAELDAIFAVNALGPVRMCRAFLSMLLESSGRVVNVSSQGGSISKKYFGPYTMTKHAMEAFTVALAEEVGPFGVRVSVVQPGGVVTPIGEKSVKADIARFRRAPAPFDAESRMIAEALAAQAAEPDEPAQAAGPAQADRGGDGGGSGEGEPESEANRKPSPPALVADAILHALFDSAPRLRYLVGTRWEGDRVIDTLIGRLVDANACPSLGYSRDELVTRLDARLRADP